MNEDTILEVALFGSDIDIDDVLSFDVVDIDNATVSVAGNILTIDSDDNYNGSLTVTVSVNDGQESDSTSFDVLVNPVNDAPELTFIEDRVIDEDTSLLLTLSATDIDGDDLTYTAGVNGNADVSIDGDQLTVDPYDNFNGDIEVTLSLIHI